MCVYIDTYIHIYEIIAAPRETIFLALEHKEFILKNYICRKYNCD